MKIAEQLQGLTPEERRGAEIMRRIIERDLAGYYLGDFAARAAGSAWLTGHPTSKRISRRGKVAVYLRRKFSTATTQERG